MENGKKHKRSFGPAHAAAVKAGIARAKAKREREERKQAEPKSDPQQVTMALARVLDALKPLDRAGQERVLGIVVMMYDSIGQ